MADHSDPRATSSAPRRPVDDASVGEVFEFVKAYAKQETIQPIVGAGRWLGYGAAAAVALSFGVAFLLLGLLRLLQTELAEHLDGRMSWLPYMIVLVVTIALLVVTLSRVKKSTLNNEPK